jgi:superfamily II DNA or RNA helicase
MRPGGAVVDLWPHQVEAIEQACKALGDGGRATQVLACGTGKTLVGAHSAAALAAQGQRLILVPTVTLLAQLVRAYRATLGPSVLGRVLAVCDERKVAAGQGDIEDLEAQHVQVSTDPCVIAQVVFGSQPVTVVSTYQSLATLTSAHRQHAMPEWDVVILDEAHRTVGGEHWSRANSDEFLPARRRLYMTATPRLITGSGAKRDLVGMDDESVYGPTIYRLGYATAIELGLLAPYRLVASVVTDADIRALTDESGGRTAMRLGHTVISARMLAAQIALLRAASTYGVTRAISYHASVADARHFAATLPGVAQTVPTGSNASKVWASHLHAEHPHSIRHTRLERLAEGVDGGLAVLSNARLLSEGVDVPAVDAVVFADPRHSTVDIIQAIGRAVRLGGRPDKVATIIVPILAEPGTDVETAFASSAYAPVWRVMRALRSHDDDLAAELDQLRRRGAGDMSTGGGQRIARWVHVDGIEVSERFVNAITVRMIESATAAWEEFYGAAIAYAEEHGDLLVPNKWVTDTGIGLGQWLHTQRTLRNRGRLRPERIRLLDAIGMVWSPHEAAWERGLAAAARYHEQHGHINVPQSFVDSDGYKLGDWILARRADYSRKRLDPARIRSLETLGITWQRAKEIQDASWERGLAAATDYRERYGDLNVPKAHVTEDGFRLGAWIDRLRQNQEDLSPERRTGLNALGMNWLGRRERLWELGYSAAADYRRDRGHLNVHANYRTRDDFLLGQWINNQRKRRDQLTSIQRERLDKLGMIWSPREAAWEQAIAVAAAFARKTGHLHPPVSFRTSDGFPLGQWLADRRSPSWKGDPKRRAQLDDLDPTWANTHGDGAAFTYGRR